jgi:hypothetical protein
MNKIIHLYLFVIAAPNGVRGNLITKRRDCFVSLAMTNQIPP